MNKLKFTVMLTPQVQAIGVNRTPVQQQSIVDRLHDLQNKVEELEEIIICYEQNSTEQDKDNEERRLLRRIKELEMQNEHLLQRRIQYPESLERRNEQLEKAIENCKMELTRLEEYNHALRFDIGILKQMLQPDQLTGEMVWHWQNDGHDHLESMRDNQAVLISALDLKELTGLHL